MPHVLENAELATPLARLDLVVRRHLGRPDVSRVPLGYGAAVVLRIFDLLRPRKRRTWAPVLTGSPGAAPGGVASKSG